MLFAFPNVFPSTFNSSNFLSFFSRGVAFLHTWKDDCIYFADRKSFVFFFKHDKNREKTLKIIFTNNEQMNNCFSHGPLKCKIFEKKTIKTPILWLLVSLPMLKLSQPFFFTSLACLLEKQLWNFK